MSILPLIDVSASVGNYSSLKVDFLQNERLDISAADGDCLIINIQVTAVISSIKAKVYSVATFQFSKKEFMLREFVQWRICNTELA